ncbi:hypothetical protein BDA99DRAFT_502677 [Phascolomyces articulosus]|uniref:Pentatricopeptide repeat-containing protein n=1 Tax=Phascolomyces articulosus TaxID=60185 RepID=A0AAD5KM89_9FUNG|nr:hypothetical protein BDA99DRAFT_502677 [Phascolomyces articulosus]
MLLSTCLCPTQRHVSRKARSLFLSVHNNLKTKPAASPSVAFCRQLSYNKYSDFNIKYPSSQWVSSLCTPRLYRELSTCRPTLSIATRSVTPILEEDAIDDEVIADDTMLQRIDSPIDILALIESAQQKQQQQQQQRLTNENSDDINEQQSDTRSQRRATSSIMEQPYCSVKGLEIWVNTNQFSQALEALCSTSRLSYYPVKIRHALYNKIAQLDAPDIVELIRPWATQYASDNTRVWRVIKDTSTFWNLGKISEMIQYCASCSEHNERLQLHLFNRLLVDYRHRRVDMSSLLQVIPRKKDGNDDGDNITIKLFNMAMNTGLRQGCIEDVELLLREMQKRNVDLDAASFNILIRLKLKLGRNSMELATSIYEQMQTRNIEPTIATFNTFIDYSCRYLLWDDLDMWVDRMKSKGIHGNSITVRILMNAMFKQRYESKVAMTFERIMSNTSMPTDESSLNPIIATLLRHKRPLTALSLLDKIFSPNETSHSPPTVYAYNLLIHGLSQKGDLEAAHQVLDAMVSKNDHRIPQPDIVSYTTLIHGYIRKAESNDIDIDTILRLYRQVRESELESNYKLQTVLLHGIIKSRYVKIEKARRLFDLIIAEDDKKLQSASQGYGVVPEEDRLNQVILYNLMMDGYFIYAYYRNQKHGLAQSSIEPQQALLNDAIRKNLELTTSSLNIWVRGLAIFNRDLYAAAALVKQFERLGIRPNERTMWYLCRTAYMKGRRDKARWWLQEYERQGHVIRGRGLRDLKRRLRL